MARHPAAAMGRIMNSREDPCAKATPAAAAARDATTTPTTAAGVEGRSDGMTAPLLLFCSSTEAPVALPGARAPLKARGSSLHDTGWGSPSRHQALAAGVRTDSTVAAGEFGPRRKSAAGPG